MRHFLYKITNNVNGKFYIGIHSTNLPFEKDTYFGSGTALKAAIRKYGKENFTKTLLKECMSREKLLQEEKELVTQNLVESADCYNLWPGGQAGPVGIHFSEEHRKHLSESGKGKHGKGVPRGPVSEETRRKLSDFWKGKPKPVEQVRKVVETRKRNGSYKKSDEWKELNRQRSTNRCWVQKEGQSKIVWKFEKNQYLAEGWFEGRAKSTTKGTRWMVRKEERKMVPVSQIPEYEKQGWKLKFQKKGIASTKYD